MEKNDQFVEVFGMRALVCLMFDLPARGMYSFVVIFFPLIFTPRSFVGSFSVALRARLTDELVGIAGELGTKGFVMRNSSGGSR